MRPHSLSAMAASGTKEQHREHQPPGPGGRSPIASPNEAAARRVPTAAEDRGPARGRLACANLAAQFPRLPLQQTNPAGCHDRLRTARPGPVWQPSLRAERSRTLTGCAWKTCSPVDRRGGQTDPCGAAASSTTIWRLVDAVPAPISGCTDATITIDHPTTNRTRWKSWTPPTAGSPAIESRGGIRDAPGSPRTGWSQ